MQIFKAIGLFLILFCTINGSLMAQSDQSKSEREEEIRFQKIAFFTDKIGLTADEAQVFWPIYNEYWAKKNKIISERKKKMSFFAENNSKLSNQEMIKFADQYINYEMQLAELLDVYHNKFKEILPIEKVMKIYLADYEFKTYLLKKIRESGKEENNE